MSNQIICYSPELIEQLDKEDRDYPIDPMVLAIFNGIRKTYGSGGSSGGGGAGGGSGSGGGMGNGSGNGSNGNIRGGNANRGRGRGNYHHGYHHGRGGYTPHNSNNHNVATTTTTVTTDSTTTRKRLYEKPEAFSDAGLLADIKTCLGKMSRDNIASITTQLLKYQLDKESCLDEIIRIIYESAIDSVYLVDLYVDIFLVIHKRFPKVIPGLNQRILREIREPCDFTNEPETLTETHKQKAERWQLSNILIFGELFLKGVYNIDLYKKFLAILISRATPADPFPLKVVAELLTKTMPKLHSLNTCGNPGNKACSDGLCDVIRSLFEISNNKAYPGQIRFPLMNIIRQY
jgi:hypothetical protein